MKRICTFLMALLLLTVAVTSFASCGRSDTSVKLINVALSEEAYAFCVAKGNAKLLADVNAYLKLIREDGTFDAICEKYFGDGSPAEIVSADRDESRDQLIVATSTGFEPFEMSEGGVFSGIDLEIAAGLASYLGKELVIEDMQFASVVTSVQGGLCDIGMAGLTVTPARQEVVAFSDLYYNANQVLIVPAANTEFDDCTTAAEIVQILNEKTADCRIGCQSGTTGAIYIDGDSDDPDGYGFIGLPVEKMEYDYAALAVTAMINGEIDYVIADNAPAEAIARRINVDFGEKWSAFWEKFLKTDTLRRVLGEGLVNTVLIAVVGLFMGIVIGTLIAAVKVMPKYKRAARVLDKICTAYVAIFRGTPIVVQLLMAYYVIFPLCGINIGSLNTCMLVFGLNSGAYVSEIMRGGIQSVDPGQMEAGRALGLGYGTTMIRIVVPQAVKNILPTLGNELIALIKDTSVVSFVAAVDLYKTFTEIGNKTYEYLIPYFIMALFYIALVAIISMGIKCIERSFKKSERRS